jgi:ABC-type spermidine/putrescine transport system permease subunit I
VSTRGPQSWGLVAPALLLLVVGLAGPLCYLAIQSLRPFVDGSALAEGWTVANYAELLRPAYAFYFFDTLRFGLAVGALAILLATPLAWIAAPTPRAALRRAILGLLIGLLFTNLVARLYAILVTYGTTGPFSGLARLFGVTAASPGFAAILVGIGLLHFVLPAAALTLIGTFQNLNPRLEEAAASLGAPRWRIALGVLLPLAAPGLISAFLIVFAMCISNFVVPLLLGRGVVLFTTNLMYVRITEIADYPSGAAIGIMMLVLVFVVVYGLGTLARRLLPGEAAA